MSTTGEVWTDHIRWTVTTSTGNQIFERDVDQIPESLRLLAFSDHGISSLFDSSHG
jgi:hypothetical protein